MSAIAPLLHREAAGEQLWLADLRRALGQDPAALMLRVRLLPPGDAARDCALPLALPETAAEAAFLRDYLRAHLLNLLSACSGSRLLLFLPETAPDSLWELAASALEGLREPGYDKALRVAARLCAAAGVPPLRWELLPLSAWQPLPLRESAAETGLGPRLRELAAAGQHGLRCGMDVGGTDVKLVLARDGKLLLARELDWDPSRCRRAEELIAPLLSLVERGLAACCPGERESLASFGLSFPDVVIGDRILGGETPKTRGMRAHDPANYEEELRRLAGLKERLEGFCRPGVRLRALNDGSMAAFTAALELACDGEDRAISRGVFAHSLGTDLGSGWLRADGSVPELPLELYDLLIDLGSARQRALPAEDLRSTRNENSGLPGARRYLGQAAAFRLAWELEPGLLEGFTEEQDGILRLRSQPEDLRKPCLEHLMTRAEAGEPAAEEIFRRIGVHLGQISREIRELLAPETEERFLFGRFVRHPRCFALIREGCAAVLPELRLIAADGDLAASPLMRELAARGEDMVARFGQAVGALYYGTEREET
jgi:hypothetical protein